MERNEWGSVHVSWVDVGTEGDAAIDIFIKLLVD